MKLAIIISCLVIFFAGAISFLAKKPPPILPVPTPPPFQSGSFPGFDPELFNQSLHQSQIINWNLPPSFQGGVIPHHLLAAKYIAAYFRLLTKNPPATLILIVPNHPEIGGNKIITTNLSLNTPFGPILPSLPTINTLQNLHSVTLNPTVVASESAVLTLTPYIKYFLPQTQIVPLVISRSSQLADIETWVNTLSPSISAGSVHVLASIDFSHYLLVKDADVRDQVTKNLIATGATQSLLPLSSEYLDSPPGLVLLMELMAKTGHPHWQLLENTNSGKLTGITGQPVTSYIIGSFYSAGAVP